MKIRQGNDCSATWSIYAIGKNVVAIEGEIPAGASLFNFSGAINAVVTLAHNTMPDVSYTVTPVIENNIVKFDIPDTSQQILGEYHLLLDFDKTNASFISGKQHYRMDCNGYEIVSPLFVGDTVREASFQSWVRLDS